MGAGASRIWAPSPNFSCFLPTLMRSNSQSNSSLSLKIKTIILSLLFLCFSCNADAITTSFDFQTLGVSNLKFLGDAHLFNNSVRLTKDLPVPDSGAGMVLYDIPVRFKLQGNPNTASFVSYFSFSVVVYNPDSIGGGLAFVISPNDDVVGDAGGYLGVPAGAVAIEFDTVMDIEFNDINGNHVGLDLGTMISCQAADLDSVNVDLRCGCQVNSWIEYSGSNHRLSIFVSHTTTKPDSPVLSLTRNFDEYVDEFMFIGFSGSTQGSTEVHSVEWWSFSSSFDESDAKPGSNSPPPAAPPPSPSPPTATTFNPPSKTVNSPPPSMAVRTTRKQVSAWKVAGILTLTIIISGGIAYSLIRCSNRFRDFVCICCNIF